MAQYTVKYSCGHAGVISLTGPVKDRKAKLDWFEKRVCPECYKAKREADSAELQREYGLIELTGSDKQVQWANSIRAEFVERMQERIDRRVAHDDRQKALAALTAAVNTQDTAKWWIDHRSNLSAALNPIYETKAKEIST